MEGHVPAVVLMDRLGPAIAAFVIIVDGTWAIVMDEALLEAGREGVLLEASETVKREQSGVILRNRIPVTTT